LYTENKTNKSIKPACVKEKHVEEKKLFSISFFCIAAIPGIIIPSIIT
jgi:hypothetical protein